MRSLVREAEALATAETYDVARVRRFGRKFGLLTDEDYDFSKKVWRWEGGGDGAGDSVELCVGEVVGDLEDRAVAWEEEECVAEVVGGLVDRVVAREEEECVAELVGGLVDRVVAREEALLAKKRRVVAALRTMGEFRRNLERLVSLVGVEGWEEVRVGLVGLRSPEIEARLAEVVERIAARRAREEEEEEDGGPGSGVAAEEEGEQVGSLGDGVVAEEVPDEVGGAGEGERSEEGEGSVEGEGSEEGEGSVEGEGSEEAGKREGRGRAIRRWIRERFRRRRDSA